jgi:hypothetical protein
LEKSSGVKGNGLAAEGLLHPQLNKALLNKMKNAAARVAIYFASIT